MLLLGRDLGYLEAHHYPSVARRVNPGREDRRVHPIAAEADLSRRRGCLALITGNRHPYCPPST